MTVLSYLHRMFLLNTWLKHISYNRYTIDTYMEPQGYKDMFVATYTSPLTGTASDPWPIRPWPSQFEASAADSTLIAIEQGDGPYNRSPNREDLSQVEVTAKVVQDRTGDGKDRGLTQRAVMGQQSATTVSYESYLWYYNVALFIAVLIPYGLCSLPTSSGQIFNLLADFCLAGQANGYTVQHGLWAAHRPS